MSKRELRAKINFIHQLEKGITPKTPTIKKFNTIEDSIKKSFPDIIEREVFLEEAYQEDPQYWDSSDNWENSIAARIIWEQFLYEETPKESQNDFYLKIRREFHIEEYDPQDGIPIRNTSSKYSYKIR